MKQVKIITLKIKNLKNGVIMSIDDIRPGDLGLLTGTMQSTQTIQSTQVPSDVTPIVNQSAMGVKIIGLMQGFSSLLIIISLIVGIIFMVKSKRTKGKRILIGSIIIVVPFILNWIISIVKMNILLNM